MDAGRRPQGPFCAGRRPWGLVAAGPGRGPELCFSQGSREDSWLVWEAGGGKAYLSGFQIVCPNQGWLLQVLRWGRGAQSLDAPRPRGAGTRH